MPIATSVPPGAAESIPAAVSAGSAASTGTDSLDGLHADGFGVAASYLDGVCDPRFTAVALTLAVCGTLTAVSTAARVWEQRGPRRVGWAAATALALGGGTWSTHLTTLIGCRLNAEIRLNPPLAMLAPLGAVVVAGLGVLIVARGPDTHWRLVGTSVFIGLGLTAASFAVLAAVDDVETVGYETGLVLLAAALAIAAAVIVLQTARYAGRTTRSVTVASSVAAALVMSGAHHVTLAAVRMPAGPGSGAPAARHVISSQPLTFGLVVVSGAAIMLMFVMLALVSDTVGRRPAGPAALIDPAGPADSAGLTDSVSSVSSAKPARSASSIRSAGPAGSAGSAKPAGPARPAGPAGSSSGSAEPSGTSGLSPAEFPSPAASSSSSSSSSVSSVSVSPVSSVSSDPVHRVSQKRPAAVSTTNDDVLDAPPDRPADGHPLGDIPRGDIPRGDMVGTPTGDNDEKRDESTDEGAARAQPDDDRLDDETKDGTSDGTEDERSSGTRGGDTGDTGDTGGSGGDGAEPSADRADVPRTDRSRSTPGLPRTAPQAATTAEDTVPLPRPVRRPSRSPHRPPAPPQGQSVPSRYPSPPPPGSSTYPTRVRTALVPVPRSGSRGT